ncbi:MAG TPA: zf-HC2 domain-containing protein, partial [Armatimonadota bacterium]|nr:zf-HC2 domain-containing protein [Armatimonadota bacterium]
MTCAEFEDRLSAYMDGELPRWARWKVQNHLRHCEGCACQLRELEAVDEAILRGVESHAAPEY